MPIPTYDTLMLPVLKHCGEKVWLMRDLVSRIADDYQLTPEEREVTIPSGASTIISNRVHWAKTYLKQAGLVSQPKRAYVEITQRGRDVLGKNPAKIDAELLAQFEEFKSFQTRTKHNGGPVPGIEPAPPVGPSSTPEEQIATASKTLDEALRDALLARILEASPLFFEKLIVDLLLRMGYGGTREGAGERLGQSGDGGVDGVIYEDRLGLDRVYLQAKRYAPDNKIGSSIVQGFIGALVGKGASKGVLITTSSFSSVAEDAAKNAGNMRLVLINGQALTDLMIRFNVGVRVAQTIEVKRIDLDYFEDMDTE
jgi:restriction system protein